MHPAAAAAATTPYSAPTSASASTPPPPPVVEPPPPPPPVPTEEEKGGGKDIPCKTCGKHINIVVQPQVAPSPGPPGWLPPWSPHLAKMPTKPSSVVVPLPRPIMPPRLPPPLPPVKPMKWWFVDAPKQQASDYDEYWVSPPAMKFHGYKTGQKFKTKGWKWLPKLGWTSADKWQFMNLKATPPGVNLQVCADARTSLLTHIARQHFRESCQAHPLQP